MTAGSVERRRPAAIPVALARRALHRAKPVLGPAAALLGLGFALRSLVLGLTLSSPVPTFDSWAFVDDLVRWRSGDYGLLDLFSQHNEHRIATARVNFFLDYAAFHLGSLSVVAADYLLFGLLAAVLAGAATRGFSLRTKVVAGALALGALWSAAGWINLVWSFQIQWAYVHLLPVLATAAFVLAAARRGARRWLLLLAACLCDGLAVFSMSSGLLAAVPVLAAAVWIRASPRLAAAFLVVHAGFAALFLWGYDFPPQPFIVSPVKLAHYLVPYLGTVFPGPFLLAVAVGGVALLISLAVLARATATALLARRRLDAPMAVLLGTVAFVLAEGLATAFGRAGMPNPAQLALRYATPSELLWTALALAVWRWLALRGRRRAARGVAALAVCAVAASNLMGGSAAAWRLWSVQADNDGFDLINGVKTDFRGQPLDPLPDDARAEIDLLRTLQLGPFAEGESRFRAPLNSLAGAVPAALPACAGAVDQFAVLNGGVYHLQGWAVMPGRPVSAVWALAMAPDGHLLGYARTWQQREDRRRLSGRAVVLGFDFWFRRPAADAGQPVEAVAVFPGGTVPPCRLALPDRPTTIAPPPPQE